MTKFKTAVLVVAGVLGLAMLVSPAASQATDEATDNSTVTVNVAEKTAVDISPSDLAYSGVQPGATLNATAAGEENFGHVEIENIGSSNITHVWFNASMPGDNPFATGVSSEYNAGNFIQIRPTGDEGITQDNDNYTFVNRKEFSTDNVPEYIFRPDNTWEVGRFRVADQEYFWAVNTTASDGSGTCSTSGGSDDFRVGNSAHTLTETGSNDFRTGGEYTAYGYSTNGDDTEAVTDTPVNISGRTYRVKVDCSSGASNADAHVIRSRYNVNVGSQILSNTVTSGANYTFDSGNTSSTDLFPGQHFSVDTRVSVPLGVAQGDVSPGALRVLVNTQ